MSTSIFRSTSYNNQSNYLNWLNKVEYKKGQVWKDQGLFDLIKLSKAGHVYNHDMFLVSLHFWEGSTNTFQLQRGMITLTLLDAASITALRPTGEVFNPFIQNDDNIGFNSKRVSITNFIADHFNETTNEVLDKEHIVFLFLWVSHFFFLSYFQVEKTFVTLANQLHSGRKIYLSQLILASLYEALNLASNAMKKFSLTKNPKGTLLLFGLF